MQTKDLIRLYMKPEHRKLIHDWLSSDGVVDWLTSVSTIAVHHEAQQLTVQVFELLETLFRLHNFDWHRHAGNHLYTTCIKDVVANGEIFICRRIDVRMAIADFVRAWNDGDSLDEVWENLKEFVPADNVDEYRKTTKSGNIVLSQRAHLCREMGFRLKRHVKWSGEVSLGNLEFGSWEKN